MDLIASTYRDDSEGSDGEAMAVEAAASLRSTLSTIQTAPEVDTSGLALVDNRAVDAAAIRHLQDPRAKQVYFNPKYEDLHAPIAGPAHPFAKDGIAAGLRNHRAGHVEDAHMNPFVFESQYHAFHSRGFAMDPTGGAMVGDAEAAATHGAATATDIALVSAAKRRKTTAEKKAEKAKREAAEASAPDGEAPWQLAQRQPWADKEVEDVRPAQLDDEQKAYLEEVAKKKEAAAAEDEEAAADGKTAKSFFHGKEERDYAGKSWLEPPRDKKRESDYCYLPKRWEHTWSGHTKGVNAIRFFPGTGHVLLSAGLDNKIKIWDVYNTKKCMRTYLGHTKGVRDVVFSNDGRRFLSTGYDKVIRLWDTESGNVIRTIDNGRMHYVAKFHPDDDKQNIGMSGCGDKKIYQWNLDTGEVIQEYDYHLGAVNTITFIDGNRRFVSTSDDKTIRVWEYGIPVQIKYLADPSMHSVPYIETHPTMQYLIGQSLDNQILSYTTKDRFRQNRKKTFKGHNCAGYACQVGFSPDGRFVLSGDAEGRVFFWEWKQPSKIVRTMKAHEGVCIGAAWHPLETSKVATCGWDGFIKYWD